MQTISWNDDLKLGIKTVDSQHRRIIGIANEFINAANQRSNGAALSHILTRLREQAVANLSVEERLMARARYSRRSVRSLENQRFKVGLKRLQRHLHTTGEATAQDITQFKQSLINHIRGAKRAVIRSIVAI
ncbi:hemerythrin domain-containing protein [Pseudodesulfovibrio sp. zrk46]|uniref:bacteriohemerythrin n=1 Tax=Pseudodesulfovibrio sp. zrk46 TaxID=2725288 RepID=UPI001448C543|nr:hemerythrin domain-containing protein [Pseudodesulfovibrio sp. zrk46]QJB58306.1 hypothetical protein HFN16_18815 [Pseudodesulfovibrio sp. zrk46]